MSTARTVKSKDALVSDAEWQDLRDSLSGRGYAVTSRVLSPEVCGQLASLYDEPDHWRSRIDMARHRFGSGEYKYFARPLPEPVARIRTEFYPQLATLANEWSDQLKMSVSYPGSLDEFLERCYAAGQNRPTPLMLRYEAGDYNCLHQDIYGEHAFPLQVMIALSRLGDDYTGGEFLLVESLPRAQSRGTAISLDQGQAVIWPTRWRPGSGKRGYYRITVRHGVSVVRVGRRHTLGVIFHDAS